MEIRQLFVTAANIGVSGKLRHGAAMVLALAVITQVYTVHFTPKATNKRQLVGLSGALCLQKRGARLQAL